MGSTPQRVKRRRRRMPLTSDIAGSMGLALQHQRFVRGLTQAEAAEKMGASVKYVGEIERGEANWTVRLIQAFADTVGWKPRAGRILPLASNATRLIRKVMELQHRHMAEMADLLMAELEPESLPDLPAQPPESPSDLLEQPQQEPQERN